VRWEFLEMRLVIPGVGCMEMRRVHYCDSPHVSHRTYFAPKIDNMLKNEKTIYAFGVEKGSFINSAPASSSR
jgi:hypothetical protein